MNSLLCLEQFQYIAELNTYLLKELNGYTEKQQREAGYSEFEESNGQRGEDVRQVIGNRTQELEVNIQNYQLNL